MAPEGQKSPAKADVSILRSELRKQNAILAMP